MIAIGTTQAEPPPDPSGEADLELLRAWGQGEQAAAATLFSRYHGVVHRFFSTKAAGAADDLTQATLLACIEGVNRLHHEACFRSYLFGIARHKLRAHYRRQIVERSQDTRHSTTSFDHDELPSTIAVQQRDIEVLLRAMNALPVETQNLLKLAYWDELSAPELAGMLRVPENTVYSRLHRAKARLRCVLGETVDCAVAQSTEHEGPRARAVDERSSDSHQGRSDF